ncbi:MAG: shikimate kinase [Clostridia bacterium]
MTLNYNQFIQTFPLKKTCVLLGNKLTHSISANIHNKICEEYGIDADYMHVELRPEQLPMVIDHIKEYYAGANVTIPYKTDVMQYLDECDEVSRRLNSVNTILVKDGKTYGYNTDIIGIFKSLSMDKVTLKNKKVALLGYGGTANVVGDILAKNESIITIFGRDAYKADLLKQQILKNYSEASVETALFTDFKDDYHAIFNTTPIGMNELEGKTPVEGFASAKYVFDCLYNPQITRLLEIADSYGIKNRNGLHMLYTQALFAQNIWNDVDFSHENNIYSQLSNELFQKRLNGRNIVLFGFMGCGKTTVANSLEKLTNMPLIDTDSLIEEKEGMKISEIFESKGEDYFRMLEGNCAFELSAKKGHIISVGGGFAINSKNIDILKSNSVFVFLDTPFDIIKNRVENDPDRPLANTETMQELYETRHPIYSSIDAISIYDVLEPDAIAEKIMGKV